MDLYSQIVKKIIEKQVSIMGPFAVSRAEVVEQLKVDWANQEVNIEGDPLTAIDELVEQYEELFGRIAVETSKEAASVLLAKLSTDQLPASLK